MKNSEIEKLNLDNWPLPDSFLIELGRISSLWGSFESLLNIALGKLSKFDNPFDPTPFIIFSHASFPQRIDILSALCEQLEQSYPNLRNYKEIVSKIRHAQSSRNRYMHNAVIFNEELNRFEIGIGSARGTLKTSVDEVHLVDLRRAALEISEAHSSLYSFVFGKKHEPVWKPHNKKSKDKG